MFSRSEPTGGAEMTDDKSKQDKRDRSKVSASEDYEVEYLMSKFDISKNRALDLIAKHGGNRRKIEDELASVDI
jgi:ABC-type lipopolysaccharide export system ATPase subunit